MAIYRLAARTPRDMLEDGSAASREYSMNSSVSPVIQQAADGRANRSVLTRDLTQRRHTENRLLIRSCGLDTLLRSRISCYRSFNGSYITFYIKRVLMADSWGSAREAELAFRLLTRGSIHF
jgi:hypothetical protein